MSERAGVSQPSRVFSSAARRSGVWAKRMSAAGRLLLHAVLLITGFLTILPFLWMLSTSLKSEGTVFIYPPKWIPDPIVWENYLEAWTFLPMGQAYVNSLKIGLIVTAGSLFTSTLAVHLCQAAISGAERAVSVLLLATMMIPGQVTLVPSYILYSYIGWIDTHLPLIVPAGAGRGVRGLPHAPVLHDDPGGPGGRRPHRRLQPVADVPAHHGPAVGAAGQLRWLSSRSWAVGTTFLARWFF